jgi:hypothetical protein
MLDHHGVLTKKSESVSVLINKEGPQPLHHWQGQETSKICSISLITSNRCAQQTKTASQTFT